MYCDLIKCENCGYIEYRKSNNSHSLECNNCEEKEAKPLQDALSINVPIKKEELDDFNNAYFTNLQLEYMWKELSDIPIDENENINVDFYAFKKGAFRESIWRWFDEKHSKGVGWLNENIF